MQYNNQRFLFKKNICSALFEFSRFLFLDNTSPALEKILSQGTLVAGTLKNFLVSWYKLGKTARRSCQYFKGSARLGIRGSLK